ncbi:30S ribosomal protein S14 [Candidatus Finniella inopinata]|uniref:Small ribosomal subunit protein uS14 n=1 Tax=Candidatus Finniella inopinata TaxID=1696036 RepID=A0A4Q7DJ49_9PROT|nr:30S ribosomal protein S14 [Candidatus Finniella inopinata]RZI46259.1 30S ribosomal protein S14 [Candidatus Finniella inopinata]
MAKRSAIENNNKKRRLAAGKSLLRTSLKKVISDKATEFEDRIQAVHKLAQLPRNTALVRVRNRCEVTGRPRSFYRKFKMSRIALRELGSQGLIPGLVKSSW